MSILRKTIPWLLLVVLFIAGGGIGMAYIIKGHVECQNEGWVPYGATVKVYEVDPLPGGSFTKEEIILTNPAKVDENGDFIIDTGSPFGSGGYELCDPDLLFVLTQRNNGAVETIYTGTYSDIHWNISDGGSVNFTITSANATCHNPDAGSSPAPDNNIFVFTRVGNHKTANIDCKGNNTTSQGYHNPSQTASGNVEENTNQPYGATLDLFGWFGKKCKIDYYKVQYLPKGATEYIDIKKDLSNDWYDTRDEDSLNWHWVSESMGPFTIDGVENLYKIPYKDKEKPDVHWSNIDRVARFDSTLAANGLCRIKVIGYKKSGTRVEKAIGSEFKLDDNYGEIVLQIDNTPPDVRIIAVNGNKKGACKILKFGLGTNDKIFIDFKVLDEKGHLKKYELEALHGHGKKVNPPPDDAKSHYGEVQFYPLWKGNSLYRVTYWGADYTSNQMPSCAYQFRLTATKRTTNGYGLIYRGIGDTWHVTIERN